MGMSDSTRIADDYFVVCTYIIGIAPKIDGIVAIDS